MSAKPSIASRICLGTAQIGMDYGIANARGRPDDAACDALLSRAVERGVLCWDTARAYGDAEMRIGRFLARCPRRDAIQVVSKLPTLPPDLPSNRVSRWVVDEVEKSLRDLRIERLAGWLLHDPNAGRIHGNAIWDAMNAQVDRGVVERIGLSVYDQHELQPGLDQPNIGAVQLPLNLLDSRFGRSGVLDEMARRSITLFARSVLLQGALTMTPEQLPKQLQHVSGPLCELRRLLGKHGVAPLDVALPFVLGHKQVDYAVIGVDDVAQLDDTLARARQGLPDGLAEELYCVFDGLPAAVVEPRRW